LIQAVPFVKIFLQIVVRQITGLALAVDRKKIIG